MTLKRRFQLVTTNIEAIEIEATVRVAFATSDRQRVNQHFGTAQWFAVYALSPAQVSLKEAVEFGQEVLDARPGDRTISATTVDSMRGGATNRKCEPPPAPDVQQRLHPHNAVPLRNAFGHDEDKLTAKIESLEGCIAVYCQEVGASAIEKLRAKRIQAIKVPAGSRIKDLIEALQQELRVGPTGWLARAIEQYKSRDLRRFDLMEQEGWVE